MGHRIAAYTPDLMDRSKISNAAVAADAELTYVGAPEALVGLAGIDTVLVDLSKKGTLEVLAGIAASGVRLIAFGSHVDTKLLDAARAAGCTEVLARSAFFSDLPNLLRA